MSFCHHLGCNNLIALHFDAPIQTELISEELTITSYNNKSNLKKIQYQIFLTEYTTCLTPETYSPRQDPFLFKLIAWRGYFS